MAAVYNFDEVIDRRHEPYSYSAKWNAAPATAEHCGVRQITDEHLALFTADMDFRCAEPIIEALHKTVDHGIFGYSTLDGNVRYFRAIRDWFATRDGWDIDMDRVVYAPGTVSALNKIVQTFTKPGDSVVVQAPVYPPFFSAVTNNGRTVANNHLVADENLHYTIDFENFEKLAAQKRTTMFILCNPHNPVGRVWTPEELQRLADICARHRVLIVADEIHGDLVRRGQHMHHMAEVAPEARVITCTAINKTFNLAGLAATNLVFSSADDRDRYTAAVGHVSPSPFAISAVVAAYEEGEDWLEQCLDYLDGTIDAVMELFAAHLPEVRVCRPEGTYVMWFDFGPFCRRYGISPEDLHQRIYEEAKVLLQDGTHFDPDQGSYFQRMCVPSARSLVLEACMRIVRVLSR